MRRGPCDYRRIRCAGRCSGGGAEAARRRRAWRRSNASRERRGEGREREAMDPAGLALPNEACPVRSRLCHPGNDAHTSLNSPVESHHQPGPIRPWSSCRPRAGTRTPKPPVARRAARRRPEWRQEGVSVETCAQYSGALAKRLPRALLSRSHSFGPYRVGRALEGWYPRTTPACRCAYTDLTSPSSAPILGTTR